MKYQPISSYPAVVLDLTIPIHNRLEAGNIINDAVKKFGIIEGYNITDIYTGPQAPEGYRNITMQCVYRSLYHTMTKEEAVFCHNGLTHEIERISILELLKVLWKDSISYKSTPPKDPFMVGAGYSGRQICPQYFLNDTSICKWCMHYFKSNDICPFRMFGKNRTYKIAEKWINIYDDFGARIRIMKYTILYRKFPKRTFSQIVLNGSKINIRLETYNGC